MLVDLQYAFAPPDMGWELPQKSTLNAICVNFFKSVPIIKNKSIFALPFDCKRRIWQSRSLLDKVNGDHSTKRTFKDAS